MSATQTITFDDSRLEELAQQEPQAPWGRRTSTFRAAVIPGVLIPAAIIVGLWFYSDLPKPVLMVAVYLPLQLLAAVGAAIAVRGTKSAADAIIIVLAIGATIFSIVVLVSLLWSIFSKGWEAMSTAFLFQNNEYISPSTPLGWGGVGHAVVGTVLIVAISALIAVPLGVMTAVYVTEVRGRAVPYVRFFVQAMSGVPSVVAGLFIFTVLILSGVLSQSAFAGALAYSILMLPTVARTAEEVLRLVPEDLRTGALALGSTRARVVLRVVIPAAKTGIITAAILGVARVVGETAPLLLTSLKNDRTVLNPFKDPITALPTYIFDNVAQPYPDAVVRAWGAALVLMIIVAILFILTRTLSARGPR
ncbi:MAG: phosphate ABC transporter permease PstA [Actinomycetales bacterium]|nr:phosphate ABC transporter permease PstA [Actinomycetales bacterium]